MKRREISECRCEQKRQRKVVAFPAGSAAAVQAVLQRKFQEWCSESAPPE